MLGEVNGNSYKGAALTWHRYRNLGLALKSFAQTPLRGLLKARGGFPSFETWGLVRFLDALRALQAT